MNTKVNGFKVLRYKGREITPAQRDSLSAGEQAHVKEQLNGPHHTSKWAKHLKHKVTLQKQFTRPFGDKRTLRATFSTCEEDRHHE